MAKINKVRLSGQTYDIEDSYAAKTVSLTQEQYDALVSGGTVDPNTLYVITDAEGVDLSDYWTSAQTESAITYATSGKAENSDFVAHSGDTSIHVTSSDKQNWNSKQAALTAGSGITIDAYNNISLAVPITSGSGNNSIVEGIGTSASGTAAHVEGYYSQANGLYSHSEGSETKANGNFSHTEGNHTIANNEAEHASGKYNVSNSGETASATTLFSVGNGTSTSARHNAFEIRQNGDIYITSGGTDIKLQDNLGGGGGSSYTAGDGIDITNDVISVTGKVDTSTYETYTAATATAIGNKLATSDFNTYSGTVDTAINSKASQSDLNTLSGTVTAHTANTDIHVTTAQTAAWNAKSDFSGSYNDLTDKPTIPTVPTSNTAFTNDAGYITSDAISGKADTSAVTESINAAVSGKVDTSTFNTYSGSVETALSGKQDTLSAGTNITIVDNVISATGGGITSGEVQTMIDEATSGYTARFAEDEEVTAAGLNALNETLSGKQATLVSGTNIKTINNESLLGSGNINIQGGSTYTAGRGISIANDTISFNLPISAGTGTNSIIEGGSTTASGDYSHAEGGSTTASGIRSHAEGYYTIASGNTSHAEGGSTKASGAYSHAEGSSTSATTSGSHAEGGSTTASGNYSHAEGASTIASGNYSHAEGSSTIATTYAEHASGRFNVSNSATTAFGDSGNTLFSVGNGTADNNRHNAFEIRQNGDIYITSGGTDIKLQDNLGGGGGTVDQTIISGSTNAVAGGAVYDKFDEVEQVTAAGLNALNDRIIQTEATIGDINTILSSI